MEPPESPQEVVHFALDGLLPATEVLAVHVPLRILSRLALDQRHPVILGEWQFSRKEFCLLYPLLMKYPEYAPYDMLYASYHYSSLSDRAIARARTHLTGCREPGAWAIEIHPITNVLSRARPRLRALGLDYVALVETGYALDRWRYRL